MELQLSKGIIMKTNILAIILFFGFFGNLCAQSERDVVDLGLPSGNLWAVKNLDEFSYGIEDYYEWGELSRDEYYKNESKNGHHYWSKYGYGWGYKFGTDNFKLTKYCNNPNAGYNGYSDNLTILTPEDDAATVALGEGWHIPTRKDWDELISNCTIRIEKNDDGSLRGLLFTAKNGNTLFLPLPYSRLGYGSGYWSSSLNTENPYSAWCFDFDEDKWGMYYYFRAVARPIRPVRSFKLKNISSSTQTVSLSTQNTPTGTNTSQATSKTVTETTEQEIFKVVEKMPSFPGGDEMLIEYIKKNLKYPQAAMDAGTQGRVFVSFVVEPDGSISNVKVLRGIGSGCDEEAVRVIKSMPKWEPGKQMGQTVRVSYNLPVNFKLPK